MIFRLITFALLAPVLAPSRAEEESEKIEIHAPAVHPGYPDYFNLRYMVHPGSVSPNHQFAPIYPTRAASFETVGPTENFLAALNPFRIVGGIETKDPYFEDENHSGFSANWSPDSSVVLVQIDAKWGPRSEHLIELRDGRIARQTDLVAEVRKLLQSDFRRAKVERYNEYYDFVLDAESGGDGFTLERSDRVRIHCTATNDPKNMESAWTMQVDGVWDVAQGKFTTQKVTRVSRKRSMP